MEANNILILNMKEYELFSIAYHNMRQQKCGVIWRERKWRRTKPIQVKLESIVDEEPVWMLAIS